VYKIAVIYSAYPDMTVAAEELIQKKGYHLEFAIAVLDKAVELAKRYEAQGFDLIISRGMTGTLIRAAVYIPVILVDITTFDILFTLYNARKHGERLAFLQYSNGLKYHDFNLIRDILNISEKDLQILYFQNEEELQKKIDQACASSVDVIVTTGTYSREVVRERGLKTIMVHSTKEAIYNAFQQAEDILNKLYQGKELLKYFTAMADDDFTGLILLNLREKIIYISVPACKLLKLNSKKNIGRSAREVFQTIPALKDYSLDQKNYKVNIKDVNLSLNKTVIQNSGELMGYALKLSYLPETVNSSSEKNEGPRNKGHQTRYQFSDVIGCSKSITSVINRAKSYGNTDLTVLITGESGTGKEVFANSIHNVSPHSNGPFIAVNCVTLPQNLLESELFGYEEGSFTGAKRGGKIGLFELANNGTIFLDEISEITQSAQAQLLRVLQEKVIRRIGGNRVIPVNVRVIAASNADLPQRVKRGQFREDLFFRLNVLHLRIPPLRERKEDIPLLVKFFITKYLGKDSKINMPDLFMKRLQNYSWPGNVRELEHVVEKFCVLYQDGQDIYSVLEELFFDFNYYKMNPLNSLDQSLTIELGTLKEMEKQIIEILFQRYSSDKASLARLLGISRTNLWSKLKELEAEN